MSRRLVFVAIAGLLSALPFTAHAVDGVSLFESFPVLRWVFWLILLTSAAAILSKGFTPEAGKSNLLRRAIAILIAAPLLYPLAQPAMAAYYLHSLCGKDAAVHTNVLTQDWSPSLPRTSVRPTSRLTDQGELEENTAPDLLQYYGRTERAVGVWEYRLRLIDQRTQQILLSARYFGDSHSGPMACQAARAYWQQNAAFVKKAWDASRGKT